MARTDVIELDRPVPKAASLRPFRDGDEVLIIAGTMKNRRAKFYRQCDWPGEVVVWVHSWQSHQTVDEDLIIHALR